MTVGSTKKRSLVWFLVVTQGLIVIALYAIQITFAVEKTRSKVNKGYEDRCNEMVKSTVQGLENLVTGYANELVYYQNADVMETKDEQQISKWLIAHADKRSADFDYVMYAEEDGKAYTDLGIVTDIAERDYFKAIMQGGKDLYIDNPVESKTTGKYVFHVARAVKVNGVTTAMVAGVVNINDLDVIVSKLTLGEKGYAYLLDGTGMVISHPNKDFIMKKNFTENLSAGHEDMEAVGQRMVKGESGSTWVKGLTSKKDLIAYSPLYGTPWSLAFSVSDMQVNTIANNLRTMMILSGIITLIILLCLINITMFKSLKPLKIVDATVRGIATGNADLTKRIELQSNNEIGSVVRGFNSFTEKLHHIMS